MVIHFLRKYLFSTCSVKQTSSLQNVEVCLLTASLVNECINTSTINYCILRSTHEPGSPSQTRANSALGWIWAMLLGPGLKLILIPGLTVERAQIGSISSQWSYPALHN